MDDLWSSQSSGTEPEGIFIDDEEKLKDVLSQALKCIDGPSAFAGGNVDANLPNPGLDIHNHGSVGLPLSAADAKSIKSKCQKSAFGKGTETYIDDSVRRCWELNPDQFTIRNPRWSHAIETLLPQVRDQLTLMCGPEYLRTELYKLLLYEEGAFFKAHQDSEKTPGMFGTLIVALPSPHEGGELALRHQKARFNFSTARNSEFGFSWAAWYSDVFHEVRPVTRGFRLVLTYNLAMRQDGRAPLSTPPSLSSFQPYLKGILAKWNNDAVSGLLPKYLVHRLEHQYTRANLGLASLKGKDRSQVEALNAIAVEADCALFLATMERVVNKDDSYGDEVFGSSLRLKHITALNGKLVSEEFELNEEYLMQEEENPQARDADDEEHEGWTGNSGCPATYWYRDTVSTLIFNYSSY
jgi:predicted 2-oxoglutarate/Fe(II)-dependent dioxygenase YbiX